MNDSTTQISDQIAALQRQVFILLLALIVVSGTLTVFLYRQSSLASRDLAAIKPQATQIINAFKQNQSTVTNFVEKLRVYGQTHQDFQQQVLKRFGIVPVPAAAPKK
jgi:hypothetical protein